jgi:hypothetical protein
MKEFLPLMATEAFFLLNWVVPPPICLAPANNAIKLPNKPTLICSSSLEASTYHFQVDTILTRFTQFDTSRTHTVTGNFVFNDSTIVDTAVTIGPLNPGTKYYWRVRGWNSTEPTLFSPVDSFTVMYAPATPVLAPPIFGSDFVILRWHRVDADSNYVCQLWTYTAQGMLLNSDTTKGDTTLKVTGLLSRSKYYWRVMAFNQGGASAFSSVDSFITVIEIPGQPTGPISPKGSGVPRRPTFIWYHVENALWYHLQVALNSSFSTIVVEIKVVDTTVQIQDTLNACTLFYWHVSAINLGGEGAFSVSVFFVTTCSGNVNTLGGIPKEFALLQNYPNPFNPTTTIRYDLSTKSYVKLIIFDALGRVVAHLVDDVQYANRYSVEWNVTNLPSGVYFYRLQTSNFTLSKKLILLR